MIEWIQTQNPVFALFLVVSSAVAVSTFGILIVNSIFTHDELMENNIIGGFKYAFLAEIVAALLGFAVLESATRFISFQNRVDREVTAHMLLTEVENAFGASVSHIASARRAYIRSVIDHEWPAMQRDSVSPRTEQALKHWYQSLVAYALESPRDNALLNAYFRNASFVIENRIARLGNVGSPFSGLVWASILAGISITIIFNWFLGSRSLLAQVTMGGLLTTAVTMLAFLAVALASPARSQLGVSAASFVPLIVN